MIATHADDGQQLRSREHATVGDRPKLTVTYATNPPNQPINPSPANNANASTTSPNICATVSDPNSGNLTVRFYGRKKVNANAKTTIIGLPDTQFYTEEPQGQNSGGGGHNGIFKAQTQWIADRRVDSSVAFVVQLGDCVQNGDANEIEWKRADTSMKKIENPNVPITHGIPYGICVGNHDQGTIGNPDGTNLFYNQYFGETRFTGRGYYGGHYGTNNDNHYELFSGGGIDFIHISIEYYANGTTASLQPVLDWADALLKTHSTRKGIISTHNMLGTGNPASFQGPGQKIYDDLKDNPNLILMLAGHVAGEGRRTDVFAGNTVHTLMSDYQSGYTNGGNGYLRIMQFLPAQNLLSVKTYSPYSNTSLTGSGSQFTLPVNLANSFTLLGTNTNVPSGTQTCINWPSLDTASEYEWYVEVSDGISTTTGPIWTFRTPVAVSGNVWHDVNAMNDNLVNNTGPLQIPPASLIPVGLRAYLVNSTTGLVEKSTIVSGATGLYNFNDVLPYTTYRIYLSSVSYPIGTSETSFPIVPIIPSGWEHTGQKLGLTPGSDGINDGKLTVPVGTNNIINANFGIRINTGDVVSG
jgi:hypothetical protein